MERDARLKFEARIADGVDWIEAFQEYSIDRCVAFREDNMDQRCPPDSTEALLTPEDLATADDVSALLDEMELSRHDA